MEEEDDEDEVMSQDQHNEQEDESRKEEEKIPNAKQQKEALSIEQLESIRQGKKINRKSKVEAIHFIEKHT